MILKTILINELSYLMEREPTTEEYKSALSYVSDALIDADKPTLHVIEEALRNWSDEQTVECIWCGKRFMPDSNPLNDHRFCCDQCRDEYEEDEDREFENERYTQSLWNDR